MSEFGKTFLVSVPDSNADTLMAVMHSWIEPDTTVISDCWGAKRDLDVEGYTHRTVNHTTGFVDERTGAYTNTIDSTRRHVKAFLSPYNRKGCYTLHLAHYMFAAKCRAEKVDQFTKFLHLVATINWSECPPLQNRVSSATGLHCGSNHRLNAWAQQQLIPCRVLGDLRSIQERSQRHTRQTATSLHTFSK